MRAEDVKTQKYPLSRYVWFVSAERQPGSRRHAVRDWVRTSAAAGKILKRAGAVPAFNRKRKPDVLDGPHGPARPATAGSTRTERAELMLGALVCVVLVVVAAMLIFVFREAWPSFAHNGLHWFGERRQRRPPDPGDLHLGRPAARSTSTRSTRGR